MGFSRDFSKSAGPYVLTTFGLRFPGSVEAKQLPNLPPPPRKLMQEGGCSSRLRNDENKSKMRQEIKTPRGPVPMQTR